MNVVAAIEATGIMVGAAAVVLAPAFVPYRILLWILGVGGAVAVATAWYAAYVMLSS